MSSHNCPIAGCPTMVRRELLMCGPHWRQVLPAIQAEVYDTYRAREREEEGALLEHHKAMEKAIACVEGREPDLEKFEVGA